MEKQQTKGNRIQKLKKNNGKIEKKVQWMDLNNFKTSETPTSQRPLIKKKKNFSRIST